jgi:phosphoribosyl 1,2-cyclic phosphodiesterase
MKLLFAGTRGEIEARSPRHRRHSSLIVIHRQKRILIDCGRDWRGKIGQLRPDVILLTHAHPDHAGGLEKGAPCSVYATQETWQGLKRMPIEKRVAISAGRPAKILGGTFEAFAVEHSVIAPAVGYRIRAGNACVFYAPDLVRIRDQHKALAGIDLYIGDGATIVRPLIRRRGHALIGHASIRDQLAWCGKEGVPRALFSHCGSAIVLGNERKLRARIRAMGLEHGFEADIACDGLEIEL